MSIQSNVKKMCIKMIILFYNMEHFKSSFDNKNNINLTGQLKHHTHSPAKSFPPARTPINTLRSG